MSASFSLFIYICYKHNHTSVGWVGVGGRAGSSPVASKARFLVSTTEKILNRTNKKKQNDASSASASKLDLEENEANKQR